MQQENKQVNNERVDCKLVLEKRLGRDRFSTVPFMP